MKPGFKLACVLFVLAILLLGTGFGLLFLVPPVYPASARIQFGDKSDGDSTMGFDPYWVQDQFLALQSDAVLSRVVTHLNLLGRWGRDDSQLPEALEMLKRNLNVRQSRSTSLFDIRYDSTDPNESADVVNAITRSYRDLRFEKRIETHQMAIANLEKLFREGQQKIAEMEAHPVKSQVQLQLLKSGQDRLTSRIQQLKATKLTSGVNILEIATPATRFVRPQRKPAYFCIAGALACAFLGAALTVRSRH